MSRGVSGSSKNYLGVQKRTQLEKKGCLFGHIDKFWKEHNRQIKKNACKNAYLGSIFIPEKYVIRVLFVSPWTSLIPPLAIRVPPPPDEPFSRVIVDCVGPLHKTKSGNRYLLTIIVCLYQVP